MACDEALKASLEGTKRSIGMMIRVTARMTEKSPFDVGATDKPRIEPSPDEASSGSADSAALDWRRVAQLEGGQKVLSELAPTTIAVVR
jgi:hypothetical protein